MSQETDKFMNKVKGAIPLSTQVSSAQTWTPKDGDYPNVPRPDIHRSNLWWWSALGGLFGLDHFYMRSPWTGLAKMFTMGGIGLWWLWDWAQLTFEANRVTKYGMSVPFDLVTGIGQGMIYDGEPTHYKQKSSYSGWIFAALFGFLGADSFVLGKWAQMIRKIFDTSILSGVMSGFFSMCFGIYMGTTGAGFWNIFSLILLFILLLVYGSFVFMPYVLMVGSTVVDPQVMFTQGVTIDNKTDKFLNYFKSWTNGMGKETQKYVAEDFGFGNISAEELREKFSINWTDPNPPKGVNASTEKKTPTTWPMSLLIGPVILGNLMGFINSIISRIYFVDAIENVYCGAVMVTNQANGEPVPSCAARMLPGAGAALDAAAAAAATASASVPAIPPSVAAATSSLPAVPTGLPTVPTGLPKIPKMSFGKQTGGAREEPLTTEAQIMGATVIALIAGGSLKGLVDYLMPQ